jgi:hypothetical protein
MPGDISVPKPEFRFEFSHAGVISATADRRDLGRDGALSYVGDPRRSAGRARRKRSSSAARTCFFALTLTFLIYRRAAKRCGAFAARLRALLVATADGADHLSISRNYDYIVNRIYYVDDITPVDIAMAVILIVLLLEATRRLIGLGAADHGDRLLSPTGSSSPGSSRCGCSTSCS